MVNISIKHCFCYIYWNPQIIPLNTWLWHSFTAHDQRCTSCIDISSTFIHCLFVCMFTLGEAGVQIQMLNTFSTPRLEFLVYTLLNMQTEQKRSCMASNMNQATPFQSFNGDVNFYCMIHTNFITVSL